MPVDSSNEERAQRILAAAGRLIAHYGYDKTTVSDIASEAGISKGAVYLHFKSKEDLLDGLLGYETSRVVNDIIARIEADPEGGTIFSLYLHSLMAVSANPVIKALMTRDKRVLGETVRRLRQQVDYDQSLELALNFVRQFQDANLIRKDLDPIHVVYYTGIIRYGFLMIDDVLPMGEKISLEQFGPVLADLLRRSLEPEGGGDREAGKRAIAHIMGMARQILEARGRDTKHES